MSDPKMERKLKRVILLRGIEAVACVFVALCAMLYAQSLNIRFEIPIEKVKTIEATGKYKTLESYIVIVRDGRDLKYGEEELKIDLPEKLLDRYMLIVAYNYEVKKAFGGFTTGRDEIDVKRMKYVKSEASRNKIYVYKLKRGIYYR